MKSLPLYNSVCTNFQRRFSKLSKLRLYGKAWGVHSGDKLCNKLSCCIIILMHYDYTLKWSIRTLMCSIRILMCSIRTLMCSIRILMCSIRILMCSIRILMCSIRTLMCSIRTLMQSCLNLILSRILLVISTKYLLGLYGNQSFETIKIHNNKSESF